MKIAANFYKKMGYIYKITNPNGKIYVGQTYNIKQRISDYRCLRYRSKKSIIIASIKKYGWDSHIIEVIEECPDELMNEREIFWIRELNTLCTTNPNGMNIAKGGGGCIIYWKHDKERVAKAKLRRGVNAPFFGKKISESAKKTISKKITEYNRLNGKKPNEKCRQASIKKLQKPLLCYDINGNFISEYESTVIAAKELKLDRKSVNDASNGKQYHAGGFVFRKKTNHYQLKIDVNIPNLQFKKREILCFQNNCLIGEYKSFKEASQKTGVSVLSIKDAFYNQRVMRSGYKFIYKDLYEGIFKEAS